MTSENKPFEPLKPKIESNVLVQYMADQLKGLVEVLMCTMDLYTSSLGL